MADLSDIENALVALVGLALYPSAYTPGSYATSNVGLSCKLYRGWPETANLNADLASGKAHVSIFSDPGMTRDVSRWQPEATQVTNIAPTVTATLSGQTIAIGGTVGAGNVVGIQGGTPIAAYAYIVQSNDTPTTIAAALAAKYLNATSSGAVITLPDTANLAAAVMAPQTVLTVTRQQIQGLRVTVWAPSPQSRDAIVSLIDNAISGMLNANGYLTKFFPVTQYESARIQYRATYSNDMPSRDLIWRRDLCYSVEYPTTLIEQDPIAMFIGGAVWANAQVIIQWGTVEPSNSVLASQDQASIFIDAAGNLIGAQPTS